MISQSGPSGGTHFDATLAAMTSIPGAAEWIDAELEGHGLRRTGAIVEPHIYPWSTRTA